MLTRAKNTIYGDPTTEKKELPLINAAAEVGIQIFVIDCGLVRRYRRLVAVSGRVVALEKTIPEWRY